MKLSFVLLVATCANALGLVAESMVCSQKTESQTKPKADAPPTQKKLPPEKEVPLVLSRTILLSYLTGDRHGGTLNIEAKAEPGKPHKESDRIVVEQAADRLLQMEKREKLFRTDLTRLAAEIGVATTIRVSTVNTGRIDIYLEWDASTWTADRIVCVYGDLKTGKITNVSFVASDGRWSR